MEQLERFVERMTRGLEASEERLAKYREKKALIYISLCRLFPLPVLIPIVLLGSLLAGGFNQGTLLAVTGAIACMIAGHWYNSWADYRTGLDVGRPRSVPKFYTGGSAILPLGLASPRKVIAGSLAFYAIFTGITCYLMFLLGTLWFILPWFLGISAAVFYSHGSLRILGGRGLKAVGFPEYCGIFGFGMGGLSYGYLAYGGEIDLWLVFFIGLVAAFPFTVGWIADQYQDAPSDSQKGVVNLGTLAWLAGTGIAAPATFGMSLAYLLLFLAIFLQYLHPLTFVAVLSAPMWMLAIIWIDKDTAKGTWYGLFAIVIYNVLLLIGQLLGGKA